MKRNHNYSVMSCFYYVEIQVLPVTTVAVSHIKIQKFNLILFFRKISFQVSKLLDLPQNLVREETYEYV